MARRGRKEGTIHQRPNGTWRAQVSLDGKRESYSARTRAEAYDWLRKMQTQIDQGMTFNVLNRSLNAYLDDWIVLKKSTLRPLVGREYERLINLYVKPTLGEMKVKELNINGINHFYQKLIEKGIGISTVRHLHRVLHAGLEYGVKTGILGRNPAHYATLPRQHHKEMEILTEQQISQFLIAASASRYQTLYYLAVITGMRISELRGLRWSDVNWIKGTISVSRQLQEDTGDGTSFSEPKTHAGYRTIKIGGTTLGELQKHRSRLEEDKLLAGANWQEYDLIFPSIHGTPFSQSNVHKDFRSILEAAGLPRIRFHDLRHTAASLMLNHGIPVVVVSRRLGHANPSVTLTIYAHTTVDMQEEAASLMDEIVTPIPVDLQGAEIKVQIPRE